MVHNEESIYFTRVAVVTPMFTGTISFFSSALIIYIAYKSRINSTYHRIMVFMSFWDMVTSFCLALSTTPMPKETIYPFQGPMYGNVHLCMAQGFIIFLGFGLVLFSNMFLALYYLCTIRYNVDKATMTRRLEPGFLIIAIIASMVLPVLFAALQNLNPTPNETFCHLGPYPFDCDGAEVPCIRGKPLSPAIELFHEVYAIGFIGIQIITIITSMFLIVHTFYVSERDLLNRNEPTQHLLNLRSMTRTIVRQALMYICASLLTWSWTIVTFFADTNAIVICNQIFVPLQGFFNAAIFVYHKVDNVQRTQGDNLNFFEALKVVLKDPNQVGEVYISGIGMISELRRNLTQDNGRLRHRSEKLSNETITEGSPALVPNQLVQPGHHSSHSATQSLCLHSFPSEPSSDPSGALSSAYVPERNKDSIELGSAPPIVSADVAQKTYYQHIRQNIQDFTIALGRESYLPIDTGPLKEEEVSTRRVGIVDRNNGLSELSTIAEENRADVI